jgi:hypothetical protein
MRLEFEHSVEGLRVIIGRRGFAWERILEVAAVVVIVYFARKMKDVVGQAFLWFGAAMSFLDFVWALGGKQTLVLTPTQLRDEREWFGIRIARRRTYAVEQLSAPHFEEGPNDERKQTGLGFYTTSGTVRFGRDLTEGEVNQIITEMETRFPELRTKWYKGVIGTDKSFTWLKL